MLSTVDVQNIAPGDYEFDIVGELGPKTFTIRYKVTLVNPCLTAELSFLPSPFVDETVRLTEEPTPQTWTISQIATVSSPVDCGLLEIQFVKENSALLDPQLFSDQRPPDGLYQNGGVESTNTFSMK